jgi:DNA-binding HxlR family transcriptional regulator
MQASKEKKLPAIAAIDPARIKFLLVRLCDHRWWDNRASRAQKQEGTFRKPRHFVVTKDTSKIAAKQFDVYDANCPTRLVLDRIADKWTVLIVGCLQDDKKRFRELQRAIGGISQKMLTQTLRGMERDGLVTRTVYPTVPATVEYSLTKLGRTLVGLLERVRDWSENNIHDVRSAQANYDQSLQLVAGKSATK